MQWRQASRRDQRPRFDDDGAEQALETDPRMVETITRCLGWYGHTRDATHHPGQPIHLAQERAKQAANRAIERLREDGVVPAPTTCL